MRTCDEGSPSLVRVPLWSRKTNRAQEPEGYFQCVARFAIT